MKVSGIAETKIEKKQPIEIIGKPFPLFIIIILSFTAFEK